MRFARMLLLPAAASVMVFWTCPENAGGSNAANGSSGPAGGIANVPERFARRFGSDQRVFFPSSSSSHTEVGEWRKSKKTRWGAQSVMFAAVAKLILFLPHLAVLAGKVVSLSLTSLLIATLVFFYEAR